MTAAISAILPSIVSGAAFSTRRYSRGTNSNNAIEGTANCVISGGQSYKALECSTELAKDLNGTKWGSKILNARDAFQEYAKGDEFVKGLGKTFQFVGDFVNYFITGTEILRVLCAEDKDEAAIESAFALGTMFTFERCAKKILGISKFKRINGTSTAIPQEALYKKATVLKEGIEKFSNWCTKTQVFGKSLKHCPSILRGLGFVAASIAGYKLGTFIAKGLINKLHEHDDKKAKTIELKPNYTQQPSQQTKQTAQKVQLNPDLLSYTKYRNAS